MTQSVAAEQAILKSLEKKVDFKFEKLPLTDVVGELEKAIQHNVCLDTKALEDAGITQDTPIDFSSHGISVQSSLNRMLSTLDLTWILVDESLQITTKEEAENHMTTRVYYVGDLIARRHCYRFERMHLPSTNQDPFPRSEPSHSGQATPKPTRDYAAGCGMGGTGGAGMFNLADPPATEGTKPAAGVDQAAGDKPMADKPATDKPAANQPGADKPEAHGSALAGGISPTPPATQQQAIPQPSFMCGGVGTNNSAAATGSNDTRTASAMNDLIDVITTSLAPTTWSVVGGPGEITSWNDSLIVTQTFVEHLKVEHFLATLRAAVHEQQTVALRATWLQLDLAQLNQLLGSKVNKHGVDRAALEAMAAKTPGFVGTITCLNGQTVHIAAGQIRTAIVGATPVVSEAVAYQPTVEKPQSGTMLQVTPQLVPGQHAVLLDLCSVVTRCEPNGETVRFPANDLAAITLDRVTTTAGQVGTTLKAPLNEPVLVGGLTIPGAKDDATSTAAGAPQLYLFIEATVK